MRTPLRSLAITAATVALALGCAVPAFADPDPDPDPDPAGGEPTAGLLADSIEAAARAGADDAVSLANEVGLPVAGPSSLTLDSDGLLAVTVVFATRPGDALLARIAAFGRVDRVNSFTPTVAASVDPARLTEVGEIPGIVAVEPVLAPIVGAGGVASAPAAPRNGTATASASSCEPFVSESSVVTRSDLARLDFGVDGSGVKIGIISDSFDVSGGRTVTSAADDVRLAALPGPGNPCGRTTPVEVVREGRPTGDDEGRAMAQLVHGIAPGATLAFSTGSGGPESMAESIIALAQSGATIIVDDMSYSTEPAFQQGVIAAAIAHVRAEYGVAYYSSSGNATVTGVGPSAGKPINGWQTDAFDPISCPAWLVQPAGATSTECMDFDPRASTQPWDQLVFDGATRPGIVVSWGEPVGGVSTRFVAQLYDYDQSPPALIAESDQTSPRIPNSGITFLGLTDEEESQTPLAAGHYALVLSRDTSAGPATTAPPVWIGAIQGQQSLAARQFDTSSEHIHIGRSTMGHASDGSAIGVAAAAVATPTTPESYTALGPGKVYFEPFDPQSATPAVALEAPVSVSAPMIAGVDMARTTFFGDAIQEGGQTVWRFGGTSAAAPTVAAVHALAQSRLGRVDADLIWQAIRDTARQMENPWASYATDASVFGAGLVDAQATLAALPYDSGTTPVGMTDRLAATGPSTRGPIGVAALVLLLGGLLVAVERGRKRSFTSR